LARYMLGPDPLIQDDLLLRAVGNDQDARHCTPLSRKLSRRKSVTRKMPAIEEAMHARFETPAKSGEIIEVAVRLSGAGLCRRPASSGARTDHALAPLSHRAVVEGAPEGAPSFQARRAATCSVNFDLDFPVVGEGLAVVGRHVFFGIDQRR